MTPDDLLATYSRYRSAKPDTLQQYQIALEFLQQFAKANSIIDHFTEDRVRDFLNWYGKRVSSPRTINNKRSAILTLWKFAAEDLNLCDPPDPRRIKREPEYRRIPTAWSIEEVGKLLAAAEWARSLPGWDSRHWVAMILTIYDTSLRLNPLLKMDRDSLDATGWLRCSAELQKGRGETVHRIHDQTIEAIEEMPDHRLMFPWPLSRRAIWPEFKRILRAAGLPATRRDLFHKLRRTSYTYVYAAMGPQAASHHAAHREDLSASYLDPTKLDRREVVDCMPRPAIFRA